LLQPGCCTYDTVFFAFSSIAHFPAVDIQTTTFPAAQMSKSRVRSDSSIDVLPRRFQMPLVRIDLREGKTKEYRKAVGDAVHRAMVETLGVPVRD
jgi:hypothetical protein